MSTDPYTAREIPTRIARDWLANREMRAGRIIAEFDCGRDAVTFCKVKGAGFTVTPGIYHVYAVRELLAVPTLSQMAPLAAI